MKKEAAISFNGVFTPAEIMLNHNLTPNAKLLYGLIRGLSKSSKGCWATNRWLGQILNVNPTTISTLISSLQSESCIYITYAKKVGLTNETVRHIYVNDDYFNDYRQTVIDFNDMFLSDDLDESFEKSKGGFKQNLSSTPFEKSQNPLLKNHNGGIDKSKAPIRKIRTNINNNIKENNIKNNNKKHTMSDFDFEQNEPISSVPPLGNSSVPKPKVSGRPARKPIQEIVTSEPKIDASKRPKRPVIKYLDLFPLDFQSDPTFKHAWSEWVEYKSTDKKGNKVLFKEQTAKGMKTKLLAFSKNDTETACKIIDMAISNGWSGLYELYDSKPTVKKYHENFKSDTKGKYDNIKETVINMDEED